MDRQQSQNGADMLKGFTKYSKRILSSIKHQESGFTLVELLVVVGIIVALASVVVPSVAALSDRGEAGAQTEEFESVQSAMDLMMVDSEVTAMNPSPSISKNNWFTFPNGAGVYPLNGYLRTSPTKFYYCWDASGNITQQHLVAASC